MKVLPNNTYIVNDSLQKAEHSVESMLPFLQHYNPSIEIVSILVPYMYYQQGNFDRAIEYCNNTLSIDPSNENAKALIQAIRIANSRKQAVNPNQLTGVIKNASGQAIPSASIRVKDTAAETLSGLKGEFSFEIPEGSTTLLISAKGYSTKEVTITKSRSYNIILK